MTAVAILGAAGRMGRTLIERVAAAEDLRLVGATVRADSEWIGRDAGDIAGCGCLDVALTDAPGDAAAAAAVVVDFTLPDALEANLAAAMAAGTPVVIGTTGVDAAGEKAIRRASAQIPIVYAANYSSGVTLLRRLVQTAAAALGDDYDVEIMEAHHRDKRDAPSGTAWALGESVARGRGVRLEDYAIQARDGIVGERPAGAIGFQALRGGDIVGEHTVMLAGDGERLELTHRASSRATFARGALRAARWAVERPAGLYDMDDVLGLNDRAPD